MPEPALDPLTGLPVADPDAAAPEFVPKADFDALSTKLDAFEKGFNAHPAALAAPTPPAPSPGPTSAEQVATIDKELADLDIKVDAAVKAEEPTASLRTKIRSLETQRNNLNIATQIDPIRTFGINAIDQLSGHALKGEMPLATKYDFVQTEMENLLSQLPADQRANPNVRLEAYKMAKGHMHEKILSAEKEEWQRDATAAAALQDVGGVNGRDGGTRSDGIPNPKDILGEDAIKALRQKGQSVDDYYRTLNYAGWEDHYTKNKDYYESL